MALLKSLPLGVCSTLLAWPAVASCLLSLKSAVYTQLPNHLCLGYTDALITLVDQPTHGTIICDRPEGTYLLLQKLMGYTQARQAIWKIVTVQPIGPLPDELMALSAGCTYKSGQPAHLVAVVQDQPTGYVVDAAWEVNVTTQAFDSVDPNRVTCQDPFR